MRPSLPSYCLCLLPSTSMVTLFNTSTLCMYHPDSRSYTMSYSSTEHVQSKPYQTCPLIHLLFTNVDTHPRGNMYLTSTGSHAALLIMRHTSLSLPVVCTYQSLA